MYSFKTTRFASVNLSRRSWSRSETVLRRSLPRRLPPLCSRLAENSLSETSSSTFHHRKVFSPRAPSRAFSRWSLNIKRRRFSALPTLSPSPSLLATLPLSSFVYHHLHKFRQHFRKNTQQLMRTRRTGRRKLSALALLAISWCPRPVTGVCPTGSTQYPALSGGGTICCSNAAPTIAIGSGSLPAGDGCSTTIVTGVAPSSSCRFSTTGSYTLSFGSLTQSMAATLKGSQGGSVTTTGGAGIAGGFGDLLTGTLDTSGFAVTSLTKSFLVTVGRGGGTTRSATTDGFGGGYSAISTVGAANPAALPNPYIIAGGGGGAATVGGNGARGGNAGYPNGQPGVASGALLGNAPGGGTQTGGGAAAGNLGPVGTAGSSGQGGSGSSAGGGGGGGGFFGGGGGTNGLLGIVVGFTGGGGGSSYAKAGTATVTEGTLTAGAGSVTVTFNPCAPEVTTSQAAGGGAGRSRQKMARDRIAMLERMRAPFWNDNPECPTNKRACRLPSGNYDCIEHNELSSCGGCVSDGTGVDCLSLEGYGGVICEQDKCVALSCNAGYIMTGERECEYDALANMMSNELMQEGTHFLSSLEEYKRAAEPRETVAQQQESPPAGRSVKRKQHRRRSTAGKSRIEIHS